MKLGFLSVLIKRTAYAAALLIFGLSAMPEKAAAESATLPAGATPAVLDGWNYAQGFKFNSETGRVEPIHYRNYRHTHRRYCRTYVRPVRRCWWSWQRRWNSYYGHYVRYKVRRCGVRYKRFRRCWR